ncbi:TM2 domain-containing protein [Anaerovorax odorimutans]|uniref:TM2 domain-containing protein n=1 Tax=Anaerovorax odorimutans TaxID=109327 RepID=UPI0003FD632E|nr:TM2 domain-containing protein [Anaerovorax odorimutans]
MDRIVKITEEKIVVGTEGGGIIEARREDLDFEPSLGDAVNIFTSETDTIIAKAIETPSLESEIEKKGININITNENASNNTGFSGTNNGRKVVNKIAYILLAIFLGSLGIHKFYSGKTGLGILYLLFCWTFIPGLIGFIEGILAIFKDPDANGNIVI